MTSCIPVGDDMARPVTGEEVCRVSQMLADGMTIKQITKATSISPATVTRIRKGLGYEETDHMGKATLKLLEQWNWVIPKRQKSNFRTPYSR